VGSVKARVITPDKGVKIEHGFTPVRVGSMQADLVRERPMVTMGEENKSVVEASSCFAE